MLGIFRGDDQNPQPLRRAAAQESDGGTSEKRRDVQVESALRRTPDIS